MAADLSGMAEQGETGSVRPILVFGGAHIDRRGRIDGVAVPGASNPGRFIEEPGGGAFNAARSLARLGHPVAFIAPRGGDAAGEAVSVAARDAGIDDRPFVFLDRATPSYTAILDQYGDLLIALADMELYRLFTPRRLKVRAVRDALDRAGLVLVDANLPEETLAAIGEACRDRGTAFAGIAISPAKALRCRPALALFDWLFMNTAEARALTGRDAERPGDWPQLLLEAGLKGGVVTGGAGSAIAFSGSQRLSLSPPPATQVVDVTGAGDALAAGFVSAFCRGGDLGAALRSGTALAALTLASPGAVPADLTPDMIAARLAHVPDVEILP